MHEYFRQIGNYVRGISRFRWYGLVSAAIVCAAGWVAVYEVPDSYEVEAKIYVDTQSMLGPLLKGMTVNTDVAQRVALMTRIAVSRPNLERVIGEVGFEPGNDTPAAHERLLTDLERKIDVRATHGKHNIYSVAFKDRDPKVAHGVVKSVVDGLMQASFTAGRHDSAAAQAFLDEQIEEYEGRLRDAESKLEAFKRKHMGSLPNQAGGYYAQLQELDNLIEVSTLKLSELERSRDQLQQQLAGERPVEVAAAGPSEAWANRVSAVQAELERLLLKYTDQHPDVVAVKERLGRLQQDYEESARAAPSAGAPGGIAYEQLKIMYGETQAEVAALKARVRGYRDKAGRLRERVDSILAVESDLKQLNRDYEVVKDQYLSLLERREQARLSDVAEKSSDRLKLRVIEPPLVPHNPVGPNRPLLITAVLGLSVGAGLLVTILLNQLKPAFVTRREVIAATGLPVLGTVGLSRTAPMYRWRMLSRTGFALGCLLVVAGYVGVLGAEIYDLPVWNIVSEAML